MDLSDEALIQQSKQGDLEAFDVLVERYQKKVFAVAYGLTQDGEAARDLTQESFVRAYQAINHFRGQARFYTWIYRITVNLCMDHFRKLPAERSAPLDDPDPVPDRTTPEIVAVQRETDSAVRMAIQALPLDQRAVIIMREIEGLSYKEIAGVMGCSIGTVMSRLFYARKKLRELLKAYL